MKEKAEQIRIKDRAGAVDPEEFVDFPVLKEDIYMDTESYSVHAVRFTPINSKNNRPMVINFHGGGFLKGRYSRHDLFCSKIANILGCEVVDVDYKLAPEHQYPVAVNESYEVTEWLFQHASQWGVDINKIILSGQSSGGNLVTTVVMRSKESKFIKPCGVVIGWAPLDLYTDPTLKPRRERDMPPERARLYNSFYCKPEQLKEIYVSPIFADETHLQHFPKTLMLIAGEDSLAAEDEAFALKLINAGVDVRVRKFQNSVHGFLTKRMDQWEDAMELLLEFLNQVSR